MKGVKGSVVIDDAHIYGIDMHMEMSVNEIRSLYKPYFSLTLPSQADPYTVSGSALYRPGKRLQLEMTIDNILSSPITLNGKSHTVYELENMKYIKDGNIYP